MDAVAAVLRSGWLTTGPRVREFEAAVAGYTGARYAIALNSCTAALHLSLLAAGVGQGDEVITTPLTFCATANAIIHTGAVPVLADIDPDTMNLDPAAVAAAITAKTARDRAGALRRASHRRRGASGSSRRARACVLIDDAAHASGRGDQRPPRRRDRGPHVLQFSRDEEPDDRRRRHGDDRFGRVGRSDSRSARSTA